MNCVWIPRKGISAECIRRKQYISGGNENGTTVFVSTALPLSLLSRLDPACLCTSPNRGWGRQRVWDWLGWRWIRARKASSQSELQCTSLVWQSTTRHTFDEASHGSVRVPLIRHAAQKFVMHLHHFASPVLSVIDRGVSGR